MQSTQRTAPVTWRISAFCASAAVVTSPPVTLAATGMRGSASVKRRAHAPLLPARAASGRNGRARSREASRRAARPWLWPARQAFSTAASAPEITVWPGEFRLAAATVRPVSAAASGRLPPPGRRKRKHGGHCALSSGNGQLHGPPASLHGAHRIGKAERPGGHMGAPLAQRVSGGQRRLHALLGQHAPGGDADGENGRLGVLGELEVLFGPFEDQFGKREAESLVGLGKGLCGNGKVSSASSRPMPTDCEPCPGKRKAIFFAFKRDFNLPTRRQRPIQEDASSSSSASCRRGRHRAGGPGRRSGRCGPGERI